MSAGNKLDVRPVLVPSGMCLHGTISSSHDPRLPVCTFQSSALSLVSYQPRHYGRCAACLPLGGAEGSGCHFGDGVQELPSGRKGHV